MRIICIDVDVDVVDGEADARFAASE